MTQELISIEKLIGCYPVDDSFFSSLQEYDLINIIEQNDEYFVAVTELPKIERIINLYTDLNVNFEGIDVILNLVEQIEEMQNEIIYLKNKLKFWGEDEW